MIKSIFDSSSSCDLPCCMNPNLRPFISCLCPWSTSYHPVRFMSWIRPFLASPISHCVISHQTHPSLHQVLVLKNAEYAHMRLFANKTSNFLVVLLRQSGSFSWLYWWRESWTSLDNFFVLIRARSKYLRKEVCVNSNLISVFVHCRSVPTIV